MAGCVPGGTGRNRHATDRHVRWSDDIDEVTRALLYDPQTSGGLLAAVPPSHVDGAVEGLLAAGYDATVIGVLETAGGDAPTITIDP
jgi:selenide,water dikinase